MGASIDQLQIDVNAQATRANDALDRLVNKLDRLQGSLGRLNTSNLTSLANGVQRLGTAMQTMNSVKTADFTRLAKNIQKLSVIDAGRLNQASASIHHFVNSLGNLKNLKVSETAYQIAQLAKGIAQLGYKSSTQAIANIPKLAVAMRQLMQILSSAPKVSQNLIDMTNALAKLSRTGASSGRAANSLGRCLNTYTSATSRATKGTFSLASAIGKLYATYWMLFRAFGKIKEAINISSSLTEVQNVVDVTFGKYASLVDKMSESSIVDFGMSELTVKKISSRYQAMGTAMGFAQGRMADMSIELTKLAADMASFYNVEQADVAEDLESIFTGQTRPLRTYGLDLTQATLQEWAMKQGLDANIQSMSQAEKALLRYQYVLSNTGAAQGDFVRTTDTWANQVRILKQNFQALGAVIGGTFINALKPMVKALNNAMVHIIAFAKTISNALGKIFGWTYEESGGGIASDFESAADSTDDIAGGLSDAEKAAKKLKTHLLGIDELNVIEPDTGDTGNGSGGGGGAGAGGASADGGQWVKTDSIFKNFESELDTLYKLGEYIGQKLTDALNKINWENTYERARNWGKGLADFLNGLISPELFGVVGKTIAGSLNTAIYFALSFGKTFDFNDFGLSIATGINEFFKTFDFGALAETLNVWVKGLWTTLTTALSKINWIDAYNGIMDFFENLDIGTVGIVIGALTVKKILSFKIAEKVMTAIGVQISAKLASVIGAKLGIALSGAGIGTVLLTAGKSIADTLWMGIAGFFGNNAAISGLAFVNPIIKALSGVGAVVTGLGTAILNFFAMWKDGFSWIKEALMVLGTAFTAVGAIILGAPALVAGVVAAITAAIGTIAIVIHDNWDSIVSFFAEAIPTFWDEYIAPWFTEEKWLGLYDTIKTSLETKWGEVKEWWSGTAIVSWWEENVKPWFKLEKWLELLDTIKKSFKTKWNETVVQWGLDIKNWWNTKVSPWFTLEKWTTMLSKIPVAFKSAFRNAANGAIGMLNNVIGGLESMINRALEGLRELARMANKIPKVNIDISAISVSLPRIPTYEIGGFPEDGLFMANSTELVGRFSNGRTAVANNEQIIEGIQGGVARAIEVALVPYLSDIARNTRETADKDFSVKLGDREVYKASERGRAETGYEVII